MYLTPTSSSLTQLTQNQVRTYGPVPISGYGAGGQITATVRYDDRCGNGHNTFSITAAVSTLRSRALRDIEAFGCLHAEITAAFPELGPLLRWHLVSSDAPLHYIENTMYWLGRRGYVDGRDGSPPNLEHARASACWPTLPVKYLITDTKVANTTVEKALRKRLPTLLADFRAAVESLGLVF